MERREAEAASHLIGTSRFLSKQIPHFATGLGDEQAAVARGAMGRAVAAAVVGLMIGAHRRKSGPATAH
jgi:hypothetical protein